MKKIWLTIATVILFLIVLVYGFEKYGKEIGLQETIRETENMSECLEQDVEQIFIHDISLPLSEGESLSCHTVDDDYVYYAVNMPVGDYEISPNSNFTKSMEKEIRAYNWKSGEEKLLYKYDVGFPIDTSDMGVCGELLYWEDYPQNIYYRVMGINLNELGECKVLFDANEVGEDSYSVTIEDDEETLFFYYQGDKGSYLYTYHENELLRLEQELFVNTEYEHPAKYGGAYIVGMKENEDLVVATMGEDLSLEIYATTSYIALLQMNEDYITYVEDADKHNQIKVIDRESRELFIVETEQFFNYGLLGHYLIINLRNKIVSVDLLTGIKEELMKSEEELYLWIFKEGKERLSFADSRGRVYVIDLK